MHTPAGTLARPFYGDTVVRAAFVIAMFGWGVGFYGPPVFLHAVTSRTGWPLPLVSAAVTLHFLLGAGVVACLPRIHRKVGIPAATSGGAIVLAVGTFGWAAAVQPWQLFVAAMFTGAGWVPLGAAGINAIVSPWFVRQRPLALAKAYNGASVGGIVFSPLWAALIGQYGFAIASIAVGLALAGVIGALARCVLNRTPHSQGQVADGGDPSSDAVPAVPALPGASLAKDRAFVTLSAAMALGLFAQIGLIAQLFSLMAPIMGAEMAGWMMALATACAMTGRLAVAPLLGRQADRRQVAAASYAIQALGTMLLSMSTGTQWQLIVPGIILFGLGIGNATSLPPLIAQAEFAPVDVPRVVAHCVALSQALYAFAPSAFAALLIQSGQDERLALGTGTHSYFAGILLIHGLAIACMLAGRRG